MWQIIGILFLCGLILHYFWWIIAAGAVVAVAVIGRKIAEASQLAADAESARQASIAARADQEHNWVMQGDPKGMYSAEAMLTIRKYQQVSQ